MTTRATRSPRRRTVVALALVLVILAAFVVRLVDIQVVNANDHIDESQALATGAKQTLYGARGAGVTWVCSAASWRSPRSVARCSAA